MCRELLARRSKRLPTFRLVPFGHRGTGLLIIDSIERTGIEPKSLQSRLQLADVVPGNARREIAICRNLSH